ASHHLDVRLGTINTGVLILSSLTMALAVRGAQTGRRSAIAGFLILTLLLGSTFLGIKLFEYHHKWVEHLVPGSDFRFEDAAHPVQNPAADGAVRRSLAAREPSDAPGAADILPPRAPAGEPFERGHAEMFFCLYFAMTGLHALHMIIGIGVLS